MLSCFDEEIDPCGNCDNCLNPPTVIDGTDQACLMMASIQQTGQFFGASHINDVLRGADTQKIRDKGHNNLASYGLGKDYSKDYWLAFMRQAVAGGYLSINVQKYGCLEITQKGRAVLNYGEPFMFREISEKNVASSRKPEKVVQELCDVDASAFLELKALRLGLAQEKNVPAYVIFSDATLRDMVVKRPATRDQMLDVSGVGLTKFEAYGELFLAAISEIEQVVQ